jgi:CubicO group peptidase (beta-lactamase class C family)
MPTEVDTFFRMDTLHGVVHDEGAAMMDGVSANAGLFSSAEDLAKLYQMLLDGGIYNGRRYLSEEAVAEFTRYQYAHEGNRRGLGFDKPLLHYDAVASSVAEAASPSSFGHSGYTGTFVWVDPEHDLLYVFLSNRVHPSRDRRAIYELNIRPRIHTLLYSFINRSE